MLTEKNLAQDETITLTCSRARSIVASMATAAATSATAVFVIEVEGISGEFISIGLFNAKTQLAADNLTGASQYGRADVPGVMKVRCRRTDATGGNGTVAFSIAEAGRW